MRVVIAPDSFKGTLTSVEVAERIAEGWRSERPADELVLKPMADGGEGTLDAFAGAVPGARRMPVRVTGPDGRLVDTSWLLLPSSDAAPRGTALVELACTSGLTLLDRLRPFAADTFGFGEAIAAALDHGVDRLLLALGGSASTDAGLGVLVALGARVLDVDGQPIGRGNDGLHALATVDAHGIRALPPGGVTVLADVTSPLLGPGGAAAVFGPQKGADSPKAVARLEAGLARAADVLPIDPATPGSGAAGGTAFGLLAWGALAGGAVTLEPGSVAVAEAVELAAAIAAAGLVVTGEGRFDTQSSRGKVVGAVAALAASAGVPVALVAGDIAAATDGFSDAVSLSRLAGDAATARAGAAHWARAAGASLAAATLSR